MGMIKHGLQWYLKVVGEPWDRWGHWPINDGIEFAIVKPLTHSLSVAEASSRLSTRIIGARLPAKA